MAKTGRPGGETAHLPPKDFGRERRRLLLATLVAFLVAAILLLVAILPAEYGLDPTGAGGLLGLTKLGGGAEPVNETANATSVFRYRLTWPTLEAPGEARTGYAREGTSRNVVVNLATANVTRVEALLTWTDSNQTGGQQTRPDLFELQVIGPDGRSGEADLGRNEAGGAGNVTADLSWRAPPSPQVVRASTDEEAASEAARLVGPDESGVGAWTFRVTLLEAGDADAQGVPIGGPAGDDGNDWSLSITVEAFRFDHVGLNASREREDRVFLEIPPGKGLEYKFAMEAGAPMEYSWNTTGAKLYFDFHGEERGKSADAYTSHKRGTMDRDSGFLDAPFAGTHGWYWENRGAEPVTLLLTTAGVYTIVGKK